MKDLFKNIKDLTADDIAMIIADNYNELMENIDNIPLFVKDIIYINEMQDIYTMEGSLLYSAFFKILRDTYSATVRTGNKENAEILKQIINLVDDKIDYIIHNGCAVLDCEICDKIDNLTSNMYFNDDKKYDMFWKNISDYIDREKMK